MARRTASFQRAKPRYRPQPTVLVICEDSKSGKHYLESASQHFRVHIQVKIVHCGKTDPLGIINEAKQRAGQFDQVYCVIDRDSHAGFPQALQTAQQHRKISVIASYPCFEFWLPLHFGYQRKPYAASGKYSAADILIKDLRKNPGFEHYDKGQDQDLFMQLLGGRFDQARRVAPKVLAEAEASGEMNPSTKLHELIEQFEKLSTPQTIA